MNTGKRVRVAVNGYGVIGKRVADAVARQDDMQLVGVADVLTDWRPRVAINRGMLQGNELLYAYMVDNQAIIVPETIDAIRALTGARSDAGASIAKTDAALGIGGLFR